LVQLDWALAHSKKWKTIGFSQNYQTQFLAKAEDILPFLHPAKAGCN
jgi:hypothetical protein